MSLWAPAAKELGSAEALVQLRPAPRKLALLRGFGLSDPLNIGAGKIRKGGLGIL